jgi:arylesterase/paraoxonase
MMYPRNPDGTLEAGKQIVEIKGLDNIMPCGDSLLVAAHFDDLAFFRHHKDADIPAPSVVFLIDPANPHPDQSRTVVYVDDGWQISAASTAFAYQNKLYISQVFGTRILVCDAGDLSGSDELHREP